ncbi:recombination mediator RecR [Caldisericum exile]|uniref:Recombination protein RecR n=1 Tax=Caldisericum exile (strain DSM 21853 / NBRC 104410 / AZM16c01) TaxID=511051 RepID=A0A7U6GEQ5_CALEA|nr:recombination mediator RecR [Caldisericum exile]BAL80967.1 recombination protein RecR [Caldisericum exile AZM16c01]
MESINSKLKSLIEEIEKLPSIGPKTAERIALYLLSLEEQEIKKFLDTLTDARANLHLCPICFNITDKEICEICSDESRDRSSICVVEEVNDLLAIEKTGSYKGVYHVLHGDIDPINHKGPDQIKLKELLDRIKNSHIKEVILATNPDFSGDMTATYIAKLINSIKMDIRITRIAVGLPKEAEIGLADTLTLSMAIKERKEYK